MAFKYENSRVRYTDQHDLDKWYEQFGRCLCCGDNPDRNSMLCLLCLKAWKIFRRYGKYNGDQNELVMFCNVYTGMHLGIIRRWLNPYDYEHYLAKRLIRAEVLKKGNDV
jgi:hypothetical protein